MNGKGGLIAGVAAGVVVIGGLLYFAMAPVEDAEITVARGSSQHKEEGSASPRTVPSVAPDIAAKDSSRATNRSEEVAAVRTKRASRFGDGAKNVGDWVMEVPEKYRPLARGIVNASDNDDLEALRELAPKARTCPDKEVRMRMVDALNWFGEKALVELTPFMRDKDPEVAHAAFNAWDTSVDMLEDEKARVKLAGAVMKTLNDPADLRSAASKFENAENRFAAVDEIVDVIESGNEAAAKVAKESYEAVMGEPYESPAQARAHALVQEKR